jgi:hypothetical protein
MRSGASSLKLDMNASARRSHRMGFPPQRKGATSFSAPRLILSRRHQALNSSDQALKARLLLASDGTGSKPRPPRFFENPL